MPGHAGRCGWRQCLRIVRTVIHEAVADIDSDAAEIVLTLHWMGGAHTEHPLPKRSSTR